MGRVTFLRTGAIVLIAFAIGIVGGIWETSAIRKYEKSKANRSGFFKRRTVSTTEGGETKCLSSRRCSRS